MTTLRTRLLVPLLLALLGVFAASCGGSEDSATETDASSSDGAAESTDDDAAAFNAGVMHEKLGNAAEAEALYGLALHLKQTPGYAEALQRVRKHRRQN